jgi:hypothetical protein
MPEKEKSETPKKGEHQDDLAEGELETVEESIRIHEEKGDLRPKR